MKTIEEKAKAYDEALERARALNNGKDVDVESGTTTCEYIFPELKEDEAERIRKNCIHFLELQKQHHAATFEIEECIAWLKKQGEKKSDNEIKPKFKIGDFIVSDYCMGKVIALTDDAYLLDTGQGIPFSCKHDAHIWTIQDAKDGDILSFYNEYKGNKFVQIGIIEKYIGKYGGCSNTFKIYIGVNWDNNLQIGNYMGCSDIHPATKEQRDILMKAMIDAGYKWNAAKKELKKKRKR